MRSVLLVAALLSSTAGAAFAELQSIHGLPEGLIVGTDGRLYFDPNAGMVRAVPGTVIGPDAAGRYLNLRAPGGPQRQGRALANTDDSGAVIALKGGLFLLDLANPFSGDGFGSPGNAGRALVPNGAGQQVVVPGRWLRTDAGWLTAVGSLAGGGAIGLASTVPLIDLAVVGLLSAGAMSDVVDTLNPWSGDGVGDFGTYGRGLGVSGGFAGQMPYYSTGNAGMAPVQYDVGPQGTTISITIPNGYNLGQMGMTPMVPAMSAPQYRIIPQYAAPAPVAYAAPAPVAYAAPTMPANLAVAPAAANAGVKCQVGDQQAVAPTVDACEEAGGLVQPMDAAQPAE